MTIVVILWAQLGQQVPHVGEAKKLAGFGGGVPRAR